MQTTKNCLHFLLLYIFVVYLRRQNRNKTMEKIKKGNNLGMVVFFELSENGVTYMPTGKTSILPYFLASEIYANSKKPMSQMIGGETKEMIEKQYEIVINNMSNENYVREHVQPQL